MQHEHWPELQQQAKEEAARLQAEVDAMREHLQLARTEAEQRAQELANTRAEL